MKKLLAIILSITILLSMAMIASAEEPVYSDSKRSVYLDGAYNDVNNIVIDDTEYLPIKELCTLLGYDIISKIYKGSVKNLVATLYENKKLSNEDMSDLKKMFELE